MRKNGLKARLGTAKYVSNRRKFHFVTDVRIQQLKQIRLKKNSESNVNWAVKAYIDWRNGRLNNFKYDVGIFEADLENLQSLTRENLEHSLCHFVPKVTKVKGEGLYPGKTLYQMIVAIQKYLVVNKMYWKLVSVGKFPDLHVVLDNVMKERTAMNIGVTKKQAAVISYEMENKLWKEGFLGEETPEKLRNTVLFLIGINIHLRAVEEHYHLRRDLPTQSSQLKFERNSKGERCLVYREDFVTKTHHGGLNDMRKDRKIVWVYPSSNTNRCPVR